ncbi:DUF362 domain-containing protein [Sporomusa acidovorans]|uniref:4Fe-4S ferredoxin-type domain-containing protein n=1 Tax=Sporomusa acidovorans (strain ATCC 49682 / DSM 3132 / Mol) TaxID=1123286 RepID=A0ABZ3J4P6_SPOA4|nr:DUF362 domain-containing protein [Sporomusa acidovorans]OZC23090.1 ferredoxin-2 [Sporomusa acidovorans DSM 3132]SDF05135.1 4Fe-4S dicluster domain-containing protein [Sporomusa acidovorans]
MKLNYDISAEHIVLEKAKKIKHIQVIKIIRDVDFVVSAAKLKTHGMMVYTGAVKNLFGVIPGLIKAEYHFKMIQGIQLEDIRMPPFKLPASLHENLLAGVLPACAADVLANTLRARPVFNYGRCISCGDCQRGCPAGIIDMSSGKPVPALDKCISCFCCHELCPAKAIDIKKNWLHRLLFAD